MFTRLSRAAHERADKDAGLGLVMVIGLAGAMTILVGVLINIVVNSLSGSARHNNFASALASAEAGIDQTLARLSEAYINDGGVSYYTPNQGITGVNTAPICDGAPIPSHEGPFASVAEERSWARQVIARAISENPSCIQHTVHGDFVAVKTQDSVDAVQQVIYAQGWAPKYGASNAKTRLLKAEYLFQPYSPQNAILANGNLHIKHSTTVTTVDVADKALADVHSNGNLTLEGCSYSISGQVSTTGSVSGNGANCNPGGGDPPLGGDGKVDITPVQEVNVGTAYKVYMQNKPWVNYPTTWYDMCPGGWIRVPSSSGPCTGSPWNGQTTAYTSGQTTPLGFKYGGTDGNGIATWTAVGVGNAGVASGVYYFNWGNVSPGTGLGNPTTANLTIIASSKDNVDFDPSNCQKLGGNITWDHDDPLAPTIHPGLFMYADADLTTSSNFHAGDATNTGLFIAGDQVHMSTSSQGAYGSVIAGDQCAALNASDENFVDNPSITYDPNGSAPFTSIINTTLWLEFVGV